MAWGCANVKVPKGLVSLSPAMHLGRYTYEMAMVTLNANMKFLDISPIFTFGCTSAYLLLIF